MAIREDIKEYLELKLKQIKFELIEQIAEKRAKTILAILLLFLSLLLLIFLSFFVSLLLNSCLESSFWGFGITSLFWFVLLAFVWLFKSPLSETLFKKYLNQNIPD